MSVIKTSAIVSQTSKYEILSFELFYQVHQSIRETYKIKYSIHVQIERKFLCRGKSPIIFEVESSYHKKKGLKIPFSFKSYAIYYQVLLDACIFAIYMWLVFISFIHRMFTAIVFVVSFVVHGIEGKTTETVNVCERFLPLQVFNTV